MKPKCYVGGEWKWMFGFINRYIKLSSYSSISVDILAALISDLHSAQQQTSLNPPSWADIERIVKKESNCI